MELAYAAAVTKELDELAWCAKACWMAAADMQTAERLTRELQAEWFACLDRLLTVNKRLPCVM